MAVTNTGTCNVLTLNFVCEDWHEFLIRNQVHHMLQNVTLPAAGCREWYHNNDDKTSRHARFFSCNITTILMYGYKHSEAYAQSRFHYTTLRLHALAVE